MNGAGNGIPQIPDLQERVQKLGTWFHNIRLGELQTAPSHFLGDYPMLKWKRFKDSIPRDLTGKTVLDVGCNAGFYSIEMKRRGAARVVGIDADKKYLAQAAFAAEASCVEIEFKQMDVYEVGQLGEKFDVVLFLGLMYHLRHPLLALDLLREHVVKDLFILQSMSRGSRELLPLLEDYPFAEVEIFEKKGYPALYFVEKRYSGDPTNWWIPNRACMEAMLRSAGFEILKNPEEEIYICRKGSACG